MAGISTRWPFILVTGLLLASCLGGCDSAELGNYELREDPDRFVNSIGMSFRRIPAGTFEMGSTSHEPDERPVHTITITKDVFFSTHEVTQQHWKMIMGENPSAFEGNDLPVEQVSWFDANDFIKALNEREGGSRYRLPTEAEWEYAARAGSGGVFFFGDNSDRLSDYAWYAPNSGGQTNYAARKRPNELGLHDVHGNVWEWVQDYYSPEYYARSPSEDPHGPVSGEHRVIRGGGWFDIPVDLRLANRGRARPTFKSPVIGFRLVRTIE